MNNKQFAIGNRLIGEFQPTYFIADISANHDGDINRAIMLIHLAAKAGADAAKFQNFRASHIVSDRGFKALGGQQSHQSKWKKSVFEVYTQASVPWDWTPVLKKECDLAGIHYFSTPYDIPAVDMLDPYVPAYKIGSGDITWPEICLHMAGKGKPLLLATGASSMDDVQGITDQLLAINKQLVLMQCNTNYTGSHDNFRHINLRVLRAFDLVFPEVILGLSDHTPGHATVLGAIALGARVIEKHFTDDNLREGPDHPFSMNPETWREMVDRAREVEAALGSASKKIAENEKETVRIQRRCIRAAVDLPQGILLTREVLDVLRPAPAEAIPPNRLPDVVGARLTRAVSAGQHLEWSYIE